MGLTRVRAEQISDIDYKQAVRVITLTNITLTVGAPNQVDGVSLAVGDRILVAGQSTASQNGLYQVTGVGTGSNGTWVRTIDGDTTGDIQAGMIVMVTEGNTWKDTSWKLITNNPITIDSTSLTFTQNTGDSFGVINANSTPVLANSVTSTVSFESGNNLSITANATSDTITFAVADAPTFTGNVSASYFIGNGSQLTGLPAGYANTNAVAYGEAGWAGNIIPSANNVYSLGNATNQWASVYVSANTLYLGNTPISASSNSLVVNGNTVVVADATGTSTTTGNISITGNISGSNINSSNVVSAAGNITASQFLGNVVSVVGNITGSILNISSITNTGANATGNIGSSSNYFNTIFAQATSAAYADLAEMYCSDEAYAPGTVVEFGGNKEITATTTSHSTSVAGIVSTHPSYLMNATLDCVNALEIALVGRVPCYVVGTINKGDRLVSSNITGVATALDKTKYEPGCIVGKALEPYDSNEVGTIEVAVGRV